MLLCKRAGVRDDGLTMLHMAKYAHPVWWSERTSSNCSRNRRLRKLLLLLLLVLVLVLVLLLLLLLLLLLILLPIPSLESGDDDSDDVDGNDGDNDADGDDDDAPKMSCAVRLALSADVNSPTARSGRPASRRTIPARTDSPPALCRARSQRSQRRGGGGGGTSVRVARV
jgi:hypothetical protein